jgi:predicted RNase H-like HicB family nuclease
MLRKFTLEYWQDDGWYIGRLKEIPNVFSQGETLADLQEQIKDAYQLLLEENSPPNPGKEINEAKNQSGEA